MTHIKKTVNEINACIKSTAAGTAVALSIALIGNMTGCNSLVLDQVEKDVATSTVHPRLNEEDAALANFQAQAKYANKKLADMKAYAQGDAK